MEVDSTHHARPPDWRLKAARKSADAGVYLSPTDFDQTTRRAATYLSRRRRLTKTDHTRLASSMPDVRWAIAVYVTASNPDKLGLADAPAADTYLQQLRSLDADALEHPILSRVLLLTSNTMLLRLGHTVEEQIALECNDSAPAEAFKRTQAPIDAFLKITRQAERHVRLSHDLQRSEQAK